MRMERVRKEIKKTLVGLTVLSQNREEKETKAKRQGNLERGNEREKNEPGRIEVNYNLNLN